MGYYKFRNGDTKTYTLVPSEEKQLFTDSISDRIHINTKFMGCEIGVLNGECSGFFINTFENLTLIGIDPIIPDSMESSLVGNVEKIYQNTNNSSRFIFVQDYSFNLNFSTDYFDFIFIDGDHTYDAVKSDYLKYKNYLKRGGLLFFHDSRMNRGGANFHVGSSKLVDEVIETDKELDLIGEAFSLTCFIKN